MSSRKSGIRHFFESHAKIPVVAGLTAFIVALAAGVFLFYHYLTGPDYAFATLRAALNEDNKAKLAVIVDFRALSADIVQAVLAVYPQAAADETRQAEMCDEAQRLALKALSAVRNTKHEAVPPRKLFEAVPFVPDDVITQFTAGMRLEKTSGEARIYSSFTHNGLQTKFPVCLLMERRRDGWLATRLLNARELVSLYKRAADALMAEDEAKLAEKNEQIRSKMRGHFASPQCLAAASLSGDRQEVMLVVKVAAKNTEATTLHNVNLLCDVRASDGRQVYSRQLHVVRRVYAGEAFLNTWTVLLDVDGEDAAGLLRAGPLSCFVEPTAMSIGVGEVLYLRKD